MLVEILLGRIICINAEQTITDNEMFYARTRRIMDRFSSITTSPAHTEVNFEGKMRALGSISVISGETDRACWSSTTDNGRRVHVIHDRILFASSLSHSGCPSIRFMASS